MEIQKKPDYLIFAEGSKSGELSDFPDIKRGWGVTLEQTQGKPPLEWMNSAFNRVDKNTLYLLQQGVPEWSEKVLYPIGAIIKVGGILYEAKKQNSNLNPTKSASDWQLVVRFQDATTKQKGIVQLSSATNSTSETQAATPLAVKTAYDLANSALPKSGGEVTGETNFTKTPTISNTPILKQGDGGLYSTSLPLISDFKSINIPSGIYGAFGAGVPNRATPNAPAGTGNSRLTVTVRCDGTVCHYEVIDNTWLSPRKWVGECYASSGSLVIYWSEVITTANVANYQSLPIGIPQPWPTNTPPSGWLKCNGSVFDKLLHPKLALVYPTGILPDLRGEFIRGLDDGRKIDIGREVLSAQNDALKSHTHDIFAKSQFSGVGGTVASVANGSSYTATTEAYGDIETRPRNIAFLYIVKAE